MPTCITIGIKRSDGTAEVLKQPSTPLSEQRDYVCNVQAYDPTYRAMYIFDLDHTVKTALFNPEQALVVTANDKTITYGDSKPALDVRYSIEPTEGDIAGTVSCACNYRKGNGAGEYQITPSGLTSDKYGITFVNGTLTVAKKIITVTAGDAEMTYGGTAPEYSSTCEGFISGEDLSNLGGEVEYIVEDSNGNEIADLSAAAVGTYFIFASGYTSDNYAFSYEAGQLTVNKAPLTLRATNKVWAEGATRPTFSCTGVGFKNGDTVDGLSGTPVYKIYKQGTDIEVELGEEVPPMELQYGDKFDIRLTGYDSDNYEITYQQGTLQIYYI